MHEKTDDPIWACDWSSRLEDPKKHRRRRITPSFPSQRCREPSSPGQRFVRCYPAGWPTGSISSRRVGGSLAQWMISVRCCHVTSAFCTHYSYWRRAFYRFLQFTIKHCAIMPLRWPNSRTPSRRDCVIVLDRPPGMFHVVAPLIISAGEKLQRSGDSIVEIVWDKIKWETRIIICDFSFIWYLKWFSKGELILEFYV